MNAHDKRMRRNVRLLQLHAVCLNLLFIIPVLVPYYQSVLGLSYRQFMIGEGGFSLAILLMEVPTGWLSDVWTRRGMMIAGTAVHVAGWALLWQAHGFIAATLAQSLLGVGVSLLSGTNSALLHETLMALNDGDSFRRREGFRFGLGLYASAVAAVAGGFLFRWHPTAPVICTGAADIAALLLVLPMTEPPRHAATGPRRHPLADMASTMRYALHGHADMAVLIVFSGLLFAATKMMFWSQQPYFMSVHIPAAHFGLLTAAGMLLGGAGGHFGHRLEGRMRDLTIVQVCYGAAAALCLTCALWSSPFLAPLLVSSSVIFGIASPRVQAMLSREAPLGRRATILSTASFAVHVFSIPLLVLTGWMTDRHGVDSTLTMLAVLAALCGLLLALAGRLRPSAKPA